MGYYRNNSNKSCINQRKRSPINKSASKQEGEDVKRNLDIDFGYTKLHKFSLEGKAQPKSGPKPTTPLDRSNFKGIN